MRIVIESSDRIGISQEILAVFAQQTWNLKAVEVISCFTYVNVEYKKLTLSKIRKSLAGIVGIVSIESINLLPSEQRENHLQALLAKMPDPIIDLDNNGDILAMNQASLELISQSEPYALIADYLGKPIELYIKQVHKDMLSDTATSHAITLHSKAYILDISPVFSKIISLHSKQELQAESQELTGSVLLLRSMNSIGRQISLMQSHQEHSFDSIIGKSNSITLIKQQSRRFRS